MLGIGGITGRFRANLFYSLILAREMYFVDFWVKENFIFLLFFSHTNVHSTFIVIAPKQETAEMPPGVNGQTTKGTTEHYLAIKLNELLTQAITV